jgi:hypothetical protein
MVSMRDISEGYSTWTYTDDLRSSVILGRDRGDSDGLSQSLDEVVLELVDLGEVCIELRSHVGRRCLSINIRPSGGSLTAELRSEG